MDSARLARLIDGPGGSSSGELLERAARALPALGEQRRHLWWLRHTDSSMWWSGAVLAHAPSNVVPLEVAIDSAEDFYRKVGAPSRFQVCASCPADLDEALAERGYRLECPMSLQGAASAQTAERSRRPTLSAQVTTNPDDRWFAIWHAVSAAEGPPLPEWHLLRRVQRPSAYVTVFDSDEAIAVGRAVADTGWTGVFGMATCPHARRRGAAMRVLSAISDWAVARQCPRLYLQVEKDNVAARQLYEDASFVEIATYHYRVKDLDDQPARGQQPMA
jgi:GNAT superfamily N-acetyltransferase